MTAFNYMGKDGERMHKFSNDAGATFSAFVSDSLIPILQAMPPGTRLDGEIESKTSKSGSSYTQVTAINGQKGTRQGGGGGQGGGGFKARGYDNKRFVEQVCVAAIGAGLVKTGEDLAKWATGAYTVISSIQTGAIKEQIGAVAAPAQTPQPSEPAKLDDPLPF